MNTQAIQSPRVVSLGEGVSAMPLKVARPVPKITPQTYTRPKSFLQVGFETICEYLSVICLGTMFKDNKVLLYVWRTVMCLFFLYLVIGAFASFCLTIFNLGCELDKVGTDAKPYEYALRALGGGCEYFFHYLFGAPRVVFCKLIEAIFGCTELIAAIAFNVFLTLLAIGVYFDILTRYRNQK